MEGTPQKGAEGQELQGGEPALAPEMKEELRLARRCFAQIERLTTLMTGYPPGHPTVEDGCQKLSDAFYEFFEITDRLTVQIHPHWMDLYGAGEAVWETKEPKDYCFALSRDGVYLLHILAGVGGAELQRFVEVLNELVDQRDLNIDAVTLLFDAGFRYISWEAVDESLAELAGLESNMKNRDTPEEQEMIDELFDKAFDEDEVVADNDGEVMDDDFEIRLQNRANQQMKLEVGSRQFLQLSQEAQEHLADLKRGFQEHRELEHRQGEVLSAVLGAKPRRKIRKGAIQQIGKVMGELLETDEPWEALTFLKLIHQWRDKFQPQVAGELKEIVKECFTKRRIQVLVKQVATSDKKGRRATLQMFNALHLDGADRALAEVLAWELDEDAREDVVRYVRTRARFGLGFVEEALPAVPGEKAGPLVEILVASMPKSRSMLVKLLSQEVEPDLKVKALRALRGTWEDSGEIRDFLVPLIKGSNSKLRIMAADSLGQAAPQHVYRVLEPLLTPALAKRPDEEVAELVRIFVKGAGPKGVNKLGELVKRKKLASEEEQELALKIVQALIKNPSPAIVELLESAAGDWLVAGKIRNTCKQVLEMIQG